MDSKSAIYHLTNRIIEEEYEKLRREKITPWAFLHSGHPFKCTKYSGEEISYSDVRYEGSPEYIFWNGFIEPFLKDIIFRTIDNTIEISRNKKINLAHPLKEVGVLLKKLVSKTYDAMADVDRKLRGNGYPNKVNKKDVSTKISLMAKLIDERVESELSIRSMTMTNEELELAILKKYVDHHKACEINNPDNSNKCSRELDMRDVIKEITGEKDQELEYSAKHWLNRLAPRTPGVPKGLLRPCSNSTVNNKTHKYNARAFTDPLNKQPAPAWERISELESKINSNKPIVQNILVIGEQIMGDKFENIKNATIINRSTVIDAFKAIKEKHGEGTADALASVAEEVENSGNQAAGTLFDSFNNELCETNPDKSKLKQYWNGLISVLPSVAQLADAAAKIGSLFTDTT